MIMSLQEIVLALLTEALEREEKNLNGYCIDGYPRTEEQLNQFKQKVNLVANDISCKLTRVTVEQWRQLSLSSSSSRKLQNTNDGLQTQQKRLFDSLLEEEPARLCTVYTRFRGRKKRQDKRQEH